MKKLYFALGTLAIIILLYVYYQYSPAKYSFFLRCPFHTLTGFDCPGCGSQRAVHCLLHGDIKGAIHQNLLLVACLPLLFIHWGYKTAALLTGKDIRLKMLYHPYTPVLIGVISMAYFVVRNLPFYPFKH